MANHANNDTKCTPGSRRGAFYFAWGAFSGGGVPVLFESRLEEVLFCQEQRHIRFRTSKYSYWYCYTVVIKGQDRYLFFEEANPHFSGRPGRWFVEVKA